MFIEIMASFNLFSRWTCPPENCEKNNGFHAGQARRLNFYCDIVFLMLACLTLSTRLVPAEEAVPFAPALPADALCSVEIAKLRPTQFAVGKWEVDRRAAKIAKLKPKKFSEYLDEHRATIVIGPQGAPYIVDGHHLCCALMKSKLRTAVDAKVAANLSRLAPGDFWAAMKKKDWVYPYDENGRGPLDVERLPKSLADLADDPYRSLAWAVREQGGWEKSLSSFAEFQWAQFFRPRIKIENQPGGIEKAIEQAVKISRTPEAKDLPGYLPDKMK
jgi:hypothetical protein